MSIEGPLSKWTNMIQGWQFRWFVLDTQQGILSYYVSKENMQKKERRGCIQLSQAFVGYDDEDDITFTITVDDKTFHLQARNLDEREKWVTVIEKTIRQHSTLNNATKAINFSQENNEEEEDETAVGSAAAVSSNDRFDSNLVELDAYLQLLIDEQKSLEEKKQNAIDQPDAERLDAILTSTQALVETIKHAIVCLQISKVNCDPSNGFHTNDDLSQILAYFHSINKKDDTKNTISKHISEHIETSSSDEHQSKPSSTFVPNEISNTADTIIGAGTAAASVSSIVGNRNILKTVVSFSSSDDENDNFEEEEEDDNNNVNQTSASNETEDNESFYDAIDLSSPNENAASNDLVVNVTDCSQQIPSNVAKIDKKPEEIVSADLFNYDEDFKDDDLDLDNQQSVISHLLTQVRIGMDLTKITLPTFILETRSLLEMYADFFAYTDLFLQIPELNCPYERMKQVVKWYMSTFRAGRKSPVAKKPYNPILGEIFQCWYDCNNSDVSSKSDEQITVTDGPVPWANRDQLTFIAEQVSHHPPISAFYAEHFNKRIQLDGYTWTKSKFLGLSIGVHMVGKAVLSLLDHNEEYILTFPSAYGRSILTVPWFEMGGQVTISCAKSGYSANIEFMTKPFYGGKKHQIQGSIFGPDKKVLNTLEGDWNGTMFIKNAKKIEILINTNSMNIIRKQIRAISEQNDNESRRLWREVTYYLRKKQIDLATNAKQSIEQGQREGVKKRKESNEKWQNKYFHEQGEHWIYLNPLSKRVNATTVTSSSSTS